MTTPMHAMVLDRLNHPLRPARLPQPRPGRGEVLLRVQACGICRTDLHIVAGELADPKLPLNLGMTAGRGGNGFVG